MAMSNLQPGQTVAFEEVLLKIELLKPKPVPNLSVENLGNQEESPPVIKKVSKKKKKKGKKKGKKKKSSRSPNQTSR